MRFLSIATTYPRSADEAGPRFVHDLNRSLLARGHTPLVLAPHAKGASTRETMDGIDIHRFRYAYPARLESLAYGGGILHNVRTRPWAAMQAPFFAWRMVQEAKRLARHESPALIHSHWMIPSGLAAARAVRRTSIAHVTTLHAGDVVGLAKLPMRAKWLRALWPYTQRIAAVSRFTAERLRRLLPPDLEKDYDARLRIAPMGIQMRPETVPAARSERLLFIGRLVEKKGLPVLLDALAQVPTIGLDIVGDGPERVRCEELARRLGLEARVRFLGRTDEVHKQRLLDLRPILVAPSLEASSGDVEGLPVVVLEALAASCAVIASDTAGNPEILRDGHNGLLVPSGDAPALADAIRRLVADESLRGRLETSARPTAEPFAWDRVAATYETIYRESVETMRR